MSCMLTWHLSFIDFQPNCTFVVLVQDSWVWYISLFFNKEMCPDHLGDCVIYPNKLRFCWAPSVNLLSLEGINYSTFSELHHGSWVFLEIPVYSEWCICQPINEKIKSSFFERKWQCCTSKKVSDQMHNFSLIVFIWLWSFANLLLLLFPCMDQSNFFLNPQS